MAIKKDFGATSVGINSFISPVPEENAAPVGETPAPAVAPEPVEEKPAASKITKKASLKKATIYFTEEELADFDLLSRFYGKSRNELAMEYIHRGMNTPKSKEALAKMKSVMQS